MIWVAEIGSAHNGSKAQAYEMIRQAKLAGATIAKFQLGWTREAQEKYAGGTANVPYNPAGDTGTINMRYIDEWAEDLAKWCDELDVEFMASIWSMSGLEIARTVEMKRYKIAHQMRDNELITEMYQDKKEMFISGTNGGPSKYIRWIYCTENYPQYPPMTKPDFSSYHGYSSHMHGYADALIAVARGAKYVEKHVTLNKADTTLRDNAFALSFEEFGEMVRIGNQMGRLR